MVILSDLVNTKENLLPVCNKPYHDLKENLPHWEELANMWNNALFIYHTKLNTSEDIVEKHPHILKTIIII